jgi:hypothetical protein
MSVDRFWSHEAHNLRCVRAADYDQLKAEAELFRLAAEELRTDLRNMKAARDHLVQTREELRQELTRARELLTEATGKLYVDTQLKLRIAAFLGPQFAPAAKEGEA